MLLTTGNAWGDGAKRTIDDVDYSSLAESDWTTPGNGGKAIYTSSATGVPSAYSEAWQGGSGGRGTYKDVSLSYTLGSGYTSSSLTDNGYVIEFDFAFTSGQNSGSGNHQGQFIVSTGSPAPNNYINDNATCLFSLSYPSTASGSTPSSLYINDLANSTGTNIAYGTYGNVWLHLKLVVTSGNINYTLTKYSDGSAVASGNKTTTGLLAINRLYALLGRGTGRIKFANYEIYDYSDAEVVTDPTIAVAYAGANRTVTITGGTSSKSNSVTTYYTTDGSTPTSLSSVYSSALDISSDCTVKAITISNQGTSSNVASEAVTVGKLTLNAPTFNKTGYSAGSYTYTIADNQSSLAFVPASTTIKYRIGSTGDFSTYSTPVAVPEGSIIYAYSEADNYTTSTTSAVTAVSLPAMTLAWGQNFVGVVNDDLWMDVSAGPTVTNAKSTSDPNYFIPSNDDGESALTDENISFYFSKDGSDDTKDKKWGLRPTGMYANYGRGTAGIKVANLIVGQIVEVSASDINSVSGLTELTTYRYAGTHYYVVTATTAYLNIARQQYVYSINVYDLDNEIVGAMDYTTPYWNKWNTTPIWINAGETAYYKFKNYNNGGNLLYQNWYLYGATEASDNVAVFGPNHTNTADGGKGSYSSKPTFTNADLNGATVELTASLAKVGETYTLTVTGVTTKADGTTKLSPNLVYTQTGLTASKLKLYISPEMNWLELLSQAVETTIGSNGFRTFASPNALDMTIENMPDGVRAFTASITGNTVSFTKLDQTVPANTGVLLASTDAMQGKTVQIPVVASGDDVDDNNFVAGTGAKLPADDDNYYFALNKNEADLTFGKFDQTNVIINTDKAYFTVSKGVFSTLGARLTINFPENPTGIGAIEAAEAESGDLKDGKYIIDNKVVIVKNGVKYSTNGQKLN